MFSELKNLENARKKGKNCSIGSEAPYVCAIPISISLSYSLAHIPTSYHMFLELKNLENARKKGKTAALDQRHRMLYHTDLYLSLPLSRTHSYQL